MKAFLVLCRNTRADFSDLAGIADAMGIDNAASVLAGIDRYYSAGRPERLWLATQLVRRLAEPMPLDEADERSDHSQTSATWDEVRQRCLSLSVAVLEEAS
jgi:RND superfamily putative drug exporter